MVTQAIGRHLAKASSLNPTRSSVLQISGFDWQADNLGVPHSPTHFFKFRAVLRYLVR